MSIKRVNHVLCENGVCCMCSTNVSYYCIIRITNYWGNWICDDSSAIFCLKSHTNLPKLSLVSLHLTWMSLSFAVKKAELKKVRWCVCLEWCQKCMMVITSSYCISFNTCSSLVHLGLHKGDTKQWNWQLKQRTQSSAITVQSPRCYHDALQPATSKVLKLFEKEIPSPPNSYSHLTDVP